MSRVLTVLYILFFAFAKAYAQDPIRYTTKLGLPSNHIYDIAEDADGFMWFATNRGLVKYDGKQFKTFTIQDGLPNNDTWLLETDYQDRLWYFSKSNQQGFIKNDSIYKFYTQDSIVISPRFTYKSKDTLWIHSGEGMHRLKNNEIRAQGQWRSENFLFNKTNINEVSQKYKLGYPQNPFIPNPERNKSIALRQNEVLFFDVDFKLITKTMVNLPDTFSNYTIDNRGLLYNQIIFYAMDTGILFINNNTRSAEYIAFADYGIEEPVKYFRCKGLKDEIQISIPGHLLVFNYNLKLTDSFSFDKKLGRISYKDRSGNVWLGDFTNGLTLLPNTQTQSTYYLIDKKVQKINRIDDEFYAGVNDNGFYKLNNKAFESVAKLSKQNGEIYQVKKDTASQKTLLISSANSFIKTNNRFSNYEINLVDGISVTSPQFGFKDIVGFKGKSYVIQGIFVSSTDEYNSNFAKTFIRKSGLLHATVFKDALYFTGSDGLHKLEKDSLVRPQLKDELLNVSVSTVLSTTKYLMVGTDGRGVYFYNGSALHHLKQTDGLSVQRIIKKDSVLWLATQNGVQKVQLKTNRLEDSKMVDAFYEADGLLQNNTNDIYLDKDTLYAASDVGLVKLNLNSPVYKQTPKLYFNKKKDTLNFKDDQRDNIAVTFSALDFVNQDYLNYEYRLFPNQKDWIATETQTINFTNLSPNLYTLEVRATDQHNNSNTIKQYLNVIPKWYETIWAKLGYILLSVLGMYAFFSWYKKQQYAKTLEKSVQEKREAGLELQALRSQMNPHFVHNSLNAIQYFIQRNEVELSETYLAQFSKLIRLFFEYSRQQTITIAQEEELLVNYLEIEKLRFEEKLHYAIKIDKSLDKDEQVIPSMLLQPIVENAVNHGLFHKPKGGLVTVCFEHLGNDSFKVLVKDNGIGIRQSKILFRESSKNYQSNSSAVLHERLELLQKSNLWDIVYDIVDLSDLNTKENGTLVTLIFTQLTSI